jgi:trehalose transport system permease protein
MLPLTVFILAFTLLPICQTILLSFQSPESGAFTIAVYQDLFKRQSFMQSIGNTWIITFLGLAIQICTGFLAAFILKKIFPGRAIVRSIVLMPMGIPTIVSGVAMLYIFMTSGYLNELFYRLGIITTPINWTSSRFLSLLQVAVADTWKVMPTVVLLFLAGLEAIPSDIYEAADIDGISPFQKLVRITIPQLRATFVMIVMLRSIDLLRIFELPMVLLGRMVPFVGTFAYEEYSYGNNNASAAASTILLVMIIVFAAVFMTLFNREGGIVNADKKSR